MKKQILLSVVFVVTGIPVTTVHGQEICEKIYVWPFTDDNGEKNHDTRALTNEVEAALTQSGCTVLQRRDYAYLANQAENEGAIKSLEGLPSGLNEELQTIEAEKVLFGTVSRDYTGNVKLQISFQSLRTKEILFQNSIFLVGENGQNIIKRQEEILKFISSCVNPNDFEEDQDWETAQKQNTKDAIEWYIEKYPSGKYRSEAQQILEEEELWSRIRNEYRNNARIDLLEDYRSRFYTRHKDEANAMLERLLWEEGRTNRYLRLFPDGHYAEEARAKKEARGEIVTDVISGLADVLENELSREKEEKEPITKIKETTYYIKARHSGRYISVKNAGMDNGSILWQWDYHGKLQQQFILEQAQDGYYYIKARHSGKYWSIKNAGMDNGSILWQWEYHGKAQQQFAFEPAQDGYYYIKAKHSGKYLSIKNAGMDNGSILRQWDYHGKTQQQFKLEER